jgi:hypothetical protein
LKIDFSYIIEFVFAVFILVIAIGTGWIVKINPKVSVDASYIDGVLTASSILYAFWAILIERKPSKNEIKKWSLYRVTIALFFVALLFLTFSVCLLYFDALGEYSSVYTFMFVTMSFLFNAYMIALSIYFYKYKLEGLEESSNNH